jgi:hypothetical protein
MSISIFCPSALLLLDLCAVAGKRIISTVHPVVIDYLRSVRRQDEESANGAFEIQGISKQDLYSQGIKGLFKKESRVGF